MIEWSINQETITIINIYAPKIRAPKYMKQILTELQGKIDSNTIIVGDFNTTLYSMDKLSRHKINKEAVELNNTVEQVYLTDI